eukprot:TRINITY_DN4168_c0_g1_i1.p1 TRINITY_DN4168_c0_g1~~TRINITY_DN4168_c0_g1_i1.p1  ORF type:complete len:662 (-),score=118.66 TRINITY_DN4168_c0_g1_i1:109-1866(-)
MTLPVSLLHDKEILTAIFNQETWEALSETDKQALQDFLPKNTGQTQEQLLSQLFGDSPFFYGSPVQKFVTDLNSGKYNAAVANYREQIEFINTKNNLIDLHNRYLNIIQQIVKAKEAHGLEIEKELKEFISSPNMQEIEKESLHYQERIQEKVERKRKRQILLQKKYYESTWSRFLIETDSHESDDSSTDDDSSIDASEEDEDYEEFVKKAKRHRQYKSKRKEKADAAQGDTGSTTQKVESIEQSFPVFSLFSKIKDIFVEHQLSASLNQVVEGVATSACLTANIPPQYSINNFVDLALHFLSNPPKLVQGGVEQSVAPLVEYSSVAAKWSWLAPVSDLTQRLESLEQIFFFASTRKKLDYNDKGVVTIPSSFLKQTKCLATFPQTSEYGVTLFHQQEKERFENHDQPYTFDILGVKSLVAPLKGFVSPSVKAREHALLVDNRPAHINLLSLIRNASSRLPGGVGTRADVSQLMRDSQYVKEGCPDKKLNQVVSGGLDRLQSFPDPPVKFDADQKLWIYTHRLRSLADFKVDNEPKRNNAQAESKVPAASGGSGVLRGSFSSTPTASDKPGIGLTTWTNNTFMGV